MANFRAITRQSGINTLIQNTNKTIVGAGIDRGNAGTLTLGGTATAVLCNVALLTAVDTVLVGSGDGTGTVGVGNIRGANVASGVGNTNVGGGDLIIFAGIGTGSSGSSLIRLGGSQIGIGGDTSQTSFEFAQLSTDQWSLQLGGGNQQFVDLNGEWLGDAQTSAYIAHEGTIPSDPTHVGGTLNVGAGTNFRKILLFGPGAYSVHEFYINGVNTGTGVPFQPDTFTGLGCTGVGLYYPTTAGAGKNASFYCVMVVS